MIRHEKYLIRIRPIIKNDLIKVLAGIRRSGKSVMLELISNELLQQGISVDQFVSYNLLKKSHSNTNNTFGI